MSAKGGSKTGYVKTDDGGDRTEEITNSGSRGNSGNNGSYSLITPNPSGKSLNPSEEGRLQKKEFFSVCRLTALLKCLLLCY